MLEKIIEPARWTLSDLYREVDLCIGRRVKEYDLSNWTPGDVAAVRDQLLATLEENPPTRSRSTRTLRRWLMTTCRSLVEQRTLPALAGGHYDPRDSLQTCKTEIDDIYGLPLEFSGLDDPGWRILMALMWKSGFVDWIGRMTADHVHFDPIFILGDIRKAGVPVKLIPCVSAWSARLSAHGNAIDLPQYSGPMEVPPPPVVIPMTWEKIDGMIDLARKEALDNLDAKHTPSEAVEDAMKLCRFFIKAAVMTSMPPYIPVYIDTSQGKRRISYELEDLLLGRQGRDAWKPLYRYLRYHRIREVLEGRGDPSLYAWIASEMFTDEGRRRASRKSTRGSGPGLSESCPAVQDGLERVDWLLKFLHIFPMSIAAFPESLPPELMRSYLEAIEAAKSE